MVNPTERSAIRNLAQCVCQRRAREIPLKILRGNAANFSGRRYRDDDAFLSRD
jgi:hypothetical protein